MSIRRLFVLFLLGAAFCTGCASNPSTYVYSRTVPTDASPVYKWTGETTDIHTLWDDEYARVEVTGYIPDDWQKPGDGYWTVEASTFASKAAYERGDEGRTAPFVGTIVRYKNAKGTELRKIAADVDFTQVGDRNFIVIDPNIEIKDGKVVKIAPVAFLRQSLDGVQTIWYEATIRLFPKQESEETPAPEPLPEEPEGTPLLSP